MVEHRQLVFRLRIMFCKLLVLSLGAIAGIALAIDRPNVLLLTVDDMSCDSVGVYGCPVPDTSPRMDALAAESMRFEHAHVQVGNCYPSRNVMWSGLYPHNNGVEGFYEIDNTGKYKVVADFFQDAGYFTAIRGKVTHTTPYNPYPGWDLTHQYPQPKPSVLKDVKSYGDSMRKAIEAAEAAEKPFLANLNVSDPHKPFYTGPKDPHQPSRVFTADEMVIPGFLLDDPAIRTELALYYSSVRRADDAVGAILDALKEGGHWDNTIIVFLSDHGMPLPFAKTSVFHHSSRTPLMIRWPGKTKAGAVDDAHMVSAVDFTPTLLEMCGIETDANFDGRSFAPLLIGETQADRDFVFKVYNENSGAQRWPMRGLQTKQHLYIFNAAATGENRFKTATQGTATYKKIVELAETDAIAAKRLKDHDYRTYEEFYDISKDPNCLVNLATDPEQAPAMKQLHRRLDEIMERTGDHCLAPFRSRSDPDTLRTYIEEKEGESAARRAGKRKKKKNKNR